MKGLLFFAAARRLSMLGRKPRAQQDFSKVEIKVTKSWQHLHAGRRGRQHRRLCRADGI